MAGPFLFHRLLVEWRAWRPSRDGPPPRLARRRTGGVSRPPRPRAPRSRRPRRGPPRSRRPPLRYIGQCSFADFPIVPSVEKPSRCFFASRFFHPLNVIFRIAPGSGEASVSGGASAPREPPRPGAVRRGRPRRRTRPSPRSSSGRCCGACRRGCRRSRRWRGACRPVYHISAPDESGARAPWRGAHPATQNVAWQATFSPGRCGSLSPVPREQAAEQPETRIGFRPTSDSVSAWRSTRL